MTDWERFTCDDHATPGEECRVTAEVHIIDIAPDKKRRRAS